MTNQTNRIDDLVKNFNRLSADQQTLIEDMVMQLLAAENRIQAALSALSGSAQAKTDLRFKEENQDVVSLPAINKLKRKTRVVLNDQAYLNIYKDIAALKLTVKDASKKYGPTIGTFRRKFVALNLIPKNAPNNGAQHVTENSQPTN